MPHTVEFWDEDDVPETNISPRPYAQRDPPRSNAFPYEHHHPYGGPPAHGHPPVAYPYDHPPPIWHYPGPTPCGYYYNPVAPPRAPPAPFHPPESPTRRVPVAPQTILNSKFETMELVYEVTDHDVLCGRGAPSSFAKGNQYFRLLIDKYQGQYLAAKRMDKPEIAMRVVALIRERGGRFLKRTKVVSSRAGSSSGSRGHFAWQDVGEQRAYEKACQALREGAPEIRRQLAAKEMAALRHANTGSSKDETRNDFSTSDEDDEVRSILS